MDAVDDGRTAIGTSKLLTGEKLAQIGLKLPLTLKVMAVLPMMNGL